MILLLIHQAAVGAGNNHHNASETHTFMIVVHPDIIHIEITLTNCTLFKIGPIYGKTRDVSGCIQPGEFFIAWDKK